jgi:Fibronectin type III domain
MPAFIATSTSALMEGNFTIRCNNIIIAMKENKDFPSPPHPIAGVETLFNDYKAVSKEKYLMSPKDYEDRRELRGKLNIKLRDNGMYVTSTFPDDRAKQLSSNYEPVRERDTSGEPNIPSRMKASANGNIGEALLSWVGSSNAKGYNVRYRIKGSEEPWEYRAVSKSRGVVISGLKPGELYEFWVLAVGAKRDSDYGGPAETRVN